MKTKLLLGITVTLILGTQLAWATPSTTAWTATTTYIQPFGVGHLTYDTYSFLGDKANGGTLPDLAVDYGFTVGILPPDWMVGGEVGLDYLSTGTFAENTYLNAKFGFTESTFGLAMQLGLFNFPLKAVSGTNDYNVTQLSVGKTWGPTWAGASYYTGNSVLGTDKSGFGLAVTHFLFSGQIFQLAADYYSGRNVLGGGMIGLYYYFAPGADILFGPTFFTDATLNGATKWSLQLDLDFNLWGR